MSGCNVTGTFCAMFSQVGGDMYMYGTTGFDEGRLAVRKGSVLLKEACDIGCMVFRVWSWIGDGAVGERGPSRLNSDLDVKLL